jgi:predicted amidophosphoribosyltransferase
MSRRFNVLLSPHALKRVKSIPPLKGLNMLQRRKTMSVTFRARPKAKLGGRLVIFVDDVLATGSTADACASALKRRKSAGRAGQPGSSDPARHRLF